MGLPSGVLSVLPGHRDITGKALASHPSVRKVDLVGNKDAAGAAGSIAGGDLATFTAELGGHAPLVVFDDGPLEEVVNAITLAGFFHAGQNGVGSMRVIVQSEIMEKCLIECVRAKSEEILKRWVHRLTQVG